MSMTHYPPPKLTGQQIKVLAWMAHGYTTAQIARRLAVSEKTVERHLQKAYERLVAVNRPHAVYVATKLGLIPDEPPEGPL